MTRCRTALAAALTAITLLATAACTTVGPSRNTVHGTVMSKSYEPAATVWHTITTPAKKCPTRAPRLGKTVRPVRACRPVPASTHREAHRVPACWDLQLSSGTHLCVTRTSWRRTRINDQV
ncbi:hypothetical protein ACFRDV_22290 [Streptomyces fagopyri]|uniref:hypothetical protein n=1 Tax=Streptomyces fagopyri TaxID=2662397 RepID=UPI00367C3F7D